MTLRENDVQDLPPAEPDPAQPKKSLQEIFAESFSRDDLEGARKWVYHWYRDLDSLLPNCIDAECVTHRSMAGHISDYLEGFNGSEPNSYNGNHATVYWETKYGKQIYDALWNYK